MTRPMAELVHFTNEVGLEVDISLTERPAGYRDDEGMHSLETINIEIVRTKMPAAYLILTRTEADHLRDLLDLAFID